MKNLKNLKEVKSAKHWGSLAKGYLLLSEQGFLYLQSKKQSGNFHVGSNVKYSLEDGNMIIASIWNLKHGLELVVKSLGVYFDNQYWNDHDLLSLFNNVKNKIIYNSLERDITVLENLVKKYHGCKFSKKTHFDDINNNYLRYPEIGVAFLDYSFVHDLKKDDIEQFLNDIFNTRRVHDLLEAEIHYYLDYWSLRKKEADDGLLAIPTIKNHGYKI